MSEIIRRKRTKQHIDGDRAVHDIERVVLERGFALERTTVDYGTDFTLHVFEDDGEYIGYLIGQSRARSGLKANRDGSYSLAVDLGHLAQWAAQLAPFLPVLYDTDRSAGYWYYVQANRRRLERSFARRGARQRAMMLRFEPAKKLDVAALDTFRRWVVQLQTRPKTSWSSRKMPRVTYRQVRHLLTDIGFQETPTKGSHLLYVHPAAQAQVMLPRADESDTLLPATWSGIRRTIFEYGIMDPVEVDERLFSART